MLLLWSLPLEHIDSTKAEVHWEAEADGHPAARGLASAAAAGTAVVLTTMLNLIPVVREKRERERKERENRERENREKRGRK